MVATILVKMEFPVINKESELAIVNSLSLSIIPADTCTTSLDCFLAISSILYSSSFFFEIGKESCGIFAFLLRNFWNICF